MVKAKASSFINQSLYPFFIENKEGNRKGNGVNISFLYQDNQLLMKFSNTTINSPYLHSFKSTKKNTNYHGYGLQIVNDIIKQYSAKYTKEYVNGYYNVYITFDLKETNNG